MSQVFMLPICQVCTHPNLPPGKGKGLRVTQRSLFTGITLPLAGVTYEDENGLRPHIPLLDSGLRRNDGVRRLSF